MATPNCQNFLSETKDASPKPKKGSLKMTSSSFVPKTKTVKLAPAKVAEQDAWLGEDNFLKGLARESTNEDSSTDESSNDSEEEEVTMEKQWSKPTGYLLDSGFSSPAMKKQVAKKSRGTYQKKYKTEMCHNYEHNGYCEFGSNCSYAHNQSELQRKTHVPSNFKTKCCSKFHYEGHCKYGNRCQFIHTLYYPSIEGYENHKLAQVDVPYTHQWAETERVIEERSMAVGDIIESGHYPSLFSGKTRLNVFESLVDQGEKEKVLKEKNYQARRRKYQSNCRSEYPQQNYN